MVDSAPANRVRLSWPPGARKAAAIGDKTRGRVLMALLDGRALPATVLGAEAGGAASTISEQLARLLDAGRSGLRDTFGVPDDWDRTA